MEERETKSKKEEILDLYLRIPEYKEVQHLGNSDFISVIEDLKEEYRKCRSRIYEHEEISDIDQISEKATKVLSFKSLYEDLSKDNRHKENNQNSFLSISKCELNEGGGEGSSSFLAKLNKNKAISSSTSRFSRSDSSRFDFSNKYYNEDNNSNDTSSGCSTPNSVLSKWSSSPEIRSKRDISPPSNVEQRLQSRLSRSQNNSASSLLGNYETKLDQETSSKCFKANPVPSHVYKPLYSFIMRKNKQRSDKVRQQSKAKLLASVKPFSFAESSTTSALKKSQANKRDQLFSNNSQENQRVYEVLNNTRPISKSKRGKDMQNIKTNNNKFKSNFRANPAPKASKASLLLAQIRLKEKQEYRDLKKKLRAEALLRNASLPPSMAARERRNKLASARNEAILCKKVNNNVLNNNFNTNKKSIFSSTETDEDRFTDDSTYSYKLTTITQPFYLSTNKPRNKSRLFTSFGESRCRLPPSGIFDSTFNDNLASRLRAAATKKKEENRMLREEEELLKTMKIEQRRKRLRDYHYSAWKKASSYSSSQDIEMRRQLREAASILERDSYKKEMSRMINRVNSAPLLLQGRKGNKEPCKKHKEELINYIVSGRSNTSEKSNYKSGRVNWTGNLRDELEAGGEKSETGALAEGSLTNSDNESINLELDNEEGQEEEERGRVEDSEEDDDDEEDKKSNNYYNADADEYNANDDENEEEIPVQDLLNDEIFDHYPN